MTDNLISIDTSLMAKVFNLGATTLVSAADQKDADIMAASWVCPLDYPLITAVIDRSHYTRKLMEKSGRFAIMLPGQGIAEEVLKFGSISKNDDPGKLEKCGAEYFYLPGSEIPMVKGCSAYALFDIVREPDNQQKYDLFIGRCTALWGDSRVLTDRAHWDFDKAPEALRTLHYVSGGQFFAIGKSLSVQA